MRFSYAVQRVSSLEFRNSNSTCASISSTETALSPKGYIRVKSGVVSRMAMPYRVVPSSTVIAQALRSLCDRSLLVMNNSSAITPSSVTIRPTGTDQLSSSLAVSSCMSIGPSVSSSSRGRLTNSGGGCSGSLFFWQRASSSVGRTRLLEPPSPIAPASTAPPLDARAFFASHSLSDSTRSFQTGFPRRSGNLSRWCTCFAFP